MTGITEANDFEVLGLEIYLSVMCLLQGLLYTGRAMSQLRKASLGNKIYQETSGNRNREVADT